MSFSVLNAPISFGLPFQKNTQTLKDIILESHTNKFPFTAKIWSLASNTLLLYILTKKRIYAPIFY